MISAAAAARPPHYGRARAVAHFDGAMRDLVHAFKFHDRIRFKNPDLNQRAQFAAANLAHALNARDESLAAAMCSYLAIRLPDLKQVLIEDREGQISVETRLDPMMNLVQMPEMAEEICGTSLFLIMTRFFWCSMVITPELQD